MIKIETKVGNLMNVAKGHIVHGCNAQGVMGSGVALAVKNTYPAAFKNYKSWISSAGEGESRMGQALPVAVSDSLIVWNAVTQNLFGSTQRFTNYEAVATCFEQVNEYISGMDDIVFPAEVHIPLIGAAR